MGSKRLQRIARRKQRREAKRVVHHVLYGAGPTVFFNCGGQASQPEARTSVEWRRVTCATCMMFQSIEPCWHCGKIIGIGRPKRTHLLRCFARRQFRESWDIADVT